jgi:hypothetical protein
MIFIGIFVVKEVSMNKLVNISAAATCLVVYPVNIMFKGLKMFYIQLFNLLCDKPNSIFLLACGEDLTYICMKSADPTNNSIRLQPYNAGGLPRSGT